jgi:hypothetical protein
MQSWAFSHNKNFNCIEDKNPFARAKGFFHKVNKPRRKNLVAVKQVES